MKIKSLLTAAAVPALVLCASLTGATLARAAAAQNPDMTNPAIKKIVDARIARLPQVDKYKASGWLGENNQGLLEVRGIEAVKDPKDREAVQAIANQENVDRNQQFNEIAKDKKVDVSEIQKQYAQTFRDRAKAGEWIQLADGVWKKK